MCATVVYLAYMRHLIVTLTSKSNYVIASYWLGNLMHCSEIRISLLPLYHVSCEESAKVALFSVRAAINVREKKANTRIGCTITIYR